MTDTLEISSSDSDDYYGNVTQKLQLLKKKYNDSTYQKNVYGREKYLNTNSIVIDDEDKCLDDSEEAILDAIIAQNSTKRATRSSSNLQAEKREILSKQTSIRRSKAVEVQEKLTQKSLESSVPRRGRSAKRKQTTTDRGRGGRGRRQVQSSLSNSILDQNIPTYSIGNTYEYPDFSHDQQLFNSKQSDITILADEIDLTDNEELSVKVYWQSSEVVKFTIRKYQKFTEMYNYFAKKENISHNKLVFMYNDKILSSEDTPDTIKYNIVKFIEGGITNGSVRNLVLKKKNTERGMKLKFQCENIKKPFEVTVEANEKLSKAMIQCAEHFEKPLEKLKFLFDGETLSGTSTPMDLELEGGECIDVKIIK